MRNWFRMPDGDEGRRLPSVNLGAALLVAVMVLCVIGILPSRTAQDDQPASPVDNAGKLLLTKDCSLVQHMSYLPCSHELTRREPLPADLIGKTRADLESAYPDWRVTSFAADQVEMTQQLALYCPQHAVLKSDDSGLLCIWQNTYGDAMSLIRELNTPLSDFDDEVQQQLRTGLGFDTMDALNQWLESAES